MTTSVLKGNIHIMRSNNISLAYDDRIIRFVNFKEHIDICSNGDKCLRSYTYTQSSKKRDPNRGISVEVESLILKKFNNLDEYLQNLEREFDGALIVRVGDFRELKLNVVSETSIDKPFHGQIYGNPIGSKINSKQEKFILACSEWLTPNTDIIIPKYEFNSS